MSIHFVNLHFVEAPASLVNQYPELINNYHWSPHPIKSNTLEVETIDPHIFHTLCDALKRKGIPFYASQPSRKGV